MPLTIKDLAALANTSAASVSRVLTGKPGVAPDKRERILELAGRLGYSPNPMARQLASNRSYVLGFIAAGLENEVYVEMLRLVQQRVAPLGYHVLIADSEHDPEKEKHNIAVMREHRAEGLMIFPVGDWRQDLSIDHFIRLRLEKYPFVLMGRIDGFEIDYVTSEEFEAGATIATHLVALGHENVCFVGEIPGNRCIVERVQGLRAAFGAEGCEFDTIPDPDDGMWLERVKDKLSRKDRPTALVMANAVYAMLAWRHLEGMGLRIPEDLSVAAFGDEVWARHLSPPLTTTHNDAERVALLGVDILLKRSSDPHGAVQRVLVPQRLIHRGSTGRACQMASKLS